MIEQKEPPMSQLETIPTQYDQNIELLEQSELGRFMSLAYQAATDLNPRLSDVVIVPLSADSSSLAKTKPAWKSESGKHEIHIRLDDLDDTLARHQATLDEIPGGCKKFSEITHVPEDKITPALLHVFSMAHELGHVTEYIDHEQDPDALRIRIRQEKAELPIGNAAVSKLLDPSSDAMAFIEANWDAIADRYNVTSVGELIEIQHSAYRDMTSERHADQFAADVFAIEPAMISSLTNPEGISTYRTDSMDKV